MPVPKDRTKVDRLQAALARIHVTEKKLAAVPSITPHLKIAAGGLKTVFAAMRFSEDPVIVAFLKKYDSIPAGDRERLPMEAVAIAAGVDTRILYYSAMNAMQEQARNAIRIIAMTSHPQITRARVRYGLRANGERDRTALDTAMGILKSPSGPTFIGKAIFGSGKSAPDGEEGEEATVSADGPDLDKLFPPASIMQERLTPIRQRMLPDKTTVEAA